MSKCLVRSPVAIKALSTSSLRIDTLVILKEGNFIYLTPEMNRRSPSNTQTGGAESSRQARSESPSSQRSQFGADFIPFDVEEFQTGEDIPGKRKHDQLEEQRQPKLARYEDGSFTTPWMRNMPSNAPKDAAQFFNDEVKAYAEYISPTHAENALRALIIEEIELYARKIWPDAIATAFGSYATGLYLPTGDIDIVIQTSYASTSTKVLAQNSLMRLATTLKNAGLAERRRVQVIAARVPIVKFNSVHAGISIDISLNQTTGLTAIAVIKRYLQHFPALRPLILIVKSYLNQRGMNEVYKGGLGSYSIICLVISFLQMHPKIRLGELDPSENLGVLLVEFFELYGSHFNYNQLGISLNRGGSYFLKMQRGWYDMNKPWLLSIVDPTDDTNDISRGSFQMLRLKQTLGGAELILTTRLLEVSQYILSKEGGYFFSLGQNDGSIETVLGRLIAMSPEAVAQRLAISDAYYNGRLQRSLSLPPPMRSPPKGSEDAGDTSDMNLSDSGQQIAAKALRRDTHAFSAEEAATSGVEIGDNDVSSQRHNSDRADDGEESRYATKPRQPIADTIYNRFGSLTDQTLQYVMSDTDDDDDSHDGGASQIAHANKRRRIESEVRPGQVRRASKRSYWGSKGQAE